MTRPLIAGALAVLIPSAVLADDHESNGETNGDKKEKDKSADVPPPVTRQGSVEIGGTPVDYDVTSAKLVLKKEDDTPRASIFHISYLRKGVEDRSERPVLFAFNGGPGSSSVWLHLGMLGPHRVELPGDGTQPPEPPARLVPNHSSILDVADLVFIDPVSTGYSRTEKGAKPEDFHGVREDVQSVGDFIRRWVSENDRWSSPKYLLGESYGGVRAAGLADHLQSRYGMSLNGVVLLSAVLDFRTIWGSDGDPLSHSVFLPTYTAVAHYHGELEGDLETLRKEAREFAFGDYAVALLQGNALPDEEKRAAAERLSELTSIDADLFYDLDLRLDPSRFRAELLDDEDKVLGRFDGRVAWPSGNRRDPSPGYDPSYSVALGTFSTAMLTYITEDLGWEEHSPYEILTGKVRPWNWGAENSVVNLTDSLSGAMRDNPHLEVLVMKGACDLATPPDGVDHSLRQMLGTSESFLDRISHAEYDSGHMFYLNPPDLEKSRDDLVDFINSDA